jgi:multidrug efflux pump subunit AcrA (membrane-fusion protein)
MDVRVSAALLAVFVALTACAAKEEEHEAEAEPVVTVQVAPALSAPIQLKVSAEAVIYPIQQAAIVPKITAPVRVFHVNRGAVVRAGQLLAELESQDLASAVAESQAALDQAEANFQTTSRASVPQEVQKAELDVRAARDSLDAQQKRYDSVQELNKQGAIAQKEVNEAQVTLTQARNQLEISQRVLQDLQGVGRDQTLKAAAAQRDAARSRLQTVQVQLGYAKITSPIDGVITDRPLYAGETAQAGTPLLTVMDLSSVIARAHISQQDAAKLKLGNTANLFPPEGGNPISAKVSQISAALDPSSTTVEVWIQAANPGMRLRAGTSLRAEVIARTEPLALIVPESAVVTEESGETFVMLVGEGDQPKKHPVTLGIRDAGNVQVTEGLKGGDRVVSTGAFELSKLEPDVLKRTKLQIQLPKEEEEEEDEK